MRSRKAAGDSSRDGRGCGAVAAFPLSAAPCALCLRRDLWALLCGVLDLFICARSLALHSLSLAPHLLCLRLQSTSHPSAPDPQASLVHLHAHLSTHRPAVQLLYRGVSPSVSPPIPPSLRHHNSLCNPSPPLERGHSGASEMLRGGAEDLEAVGVESGLWGSMSRREWLDAEVLCALLWLLLMGCAELGVGAACWRGGK